MPEATIVKVTATPALTVLPAGWVVIVGATVCAESCVANAAARHASSAPARRGRQRGAGRVVLEIRGAGWGAWAARDRVTALATLA